MATRPSNVTVCEFCGKVVGVQKEFNMNHQRGGPAWRVALHGGKDRCPGSRIVVPDLMVERKTYLAV